MRQRRWHRRRRVNRRVTVRGRLQNLVSHPCRWLAHCGLPPSAWLDPTRYCPTVPSGRRCLKYTACPRSSLAPVAERHCDPRPPSRRASLQLPGRGARRPRRSGVAGYPRSPAHRHREPRLRSRSRGSVTPTDRAVPPHHPSADPHREESGVLTDPPQPPAAQARVLPGGATEIRHRPPHRTPPGSRSAPPSGSAPGQPAWGSSGGS